MIESWNKHVYNATKIVEIEIGGPLFAGSIFKSVIIVYLNINEKTLRERTKKRNISYEATLNYKIKKINNPALKGGVCWFNTILQMDESINSRPKGRGIKPTDRIKAADLPVIVIDI
jgi:hypothetical protein